MLTRKVFHEVVVVWNTIPHLVARHFLPLPRMLKFIPSFHLICLPPFSKRLLVQHSELPTEI